jgi:glycosyltransferase involved in cell wall biosynthesis
MFDMLPKIGVVIIGINVEKVLPKCIESVLKSDYPKSQIEMIYVDGGSKDCSVDMAKRYPALKIIELDSIHPTPGGGRNAGWKELNTPYIQFLDADTEVDPSWFQNALPHLFNPEVAAVCGHRRECNPNKNKYHIIGNMEWKYETGPCRYFGGDVLIKRNILLNTKGFDDDLIAGEDPELSYRIRQENKFILRIDKPMTRHELNMSSFNQYLKRAYRSGYAYAQISLRFCKRKEKLWVRETVRVIGKALAPFLILVAGFLLGHPLTGGLVSFLIFILPLFKASNFKKKFSETWGKSILYSAHTCLVIFPQFAGMVRYFFGAWTQMPLKNNSIKIGLQQKEGV